LNSENVKTDSTVKQPIVSYRFFPMVFTLVSPIQMLKDNLFKSKSSKSYKNNLKNSLGSASIDFDNNLLENRIDTKYSKILSENDLFDLEHNFNKNTNLNKYSNNKSNYSLQNDIIETNKNEYMDGDVDFNILNTSINSEEARNRMQNSGASQLKHENSSIMFNQTTLSVKQFKDPYFQRAKSRSRNASSYIYERKGTSTKNILNQIETLENNFRTNNFEGRNGW
jgi:hypothetical protein